MRSLYIEMTSYDQGFHAGQASAFRLLAKFLREGRYVPVDLLDKWEAEAVAKSNTAKEQIKEHEEALNEQS